MGQVKAVHHSSSSYSPCPYLTVAMLLAIVFSFTLPATAQRGSDWNPSVYYGIPVDDKPEIFFDEFDDNRNNWNLSSERLEMRINNGEFYCESPNQTFVKQRMISLDQNENYEIEVNIRFVRGNEGGATGLTFGRDYKGNEYNFYFTPAGKYKIFKYQGRTINYKNWTSHGTLSKHAHNVLTVRKVDERWYFFINYVLVAETRAGRLFGKNFGFTIGNNMAIEVDYLRVSGIKMRDTAGPKISLQQPLVNSSRIAQFYSDRQDIKFRVTDMSGVAEVSINDTPVKVSPGGYVNETIGPLMAGYTPISIKAKDHAGNTSEEFFNVLFSPNDYNTLSESLSGRGKNYLLLIGVNNYTHWSRLHNAVKDCGDLSGVLTAEYRFTEPEIITLYNDQATRENILETLERLQDQISPEDNLLIYYAGHGFYDTNANLGYWVPVEARLNKISDFIRNSTIHDYLKTINSKHTLLIADACYAGSLFARDRGQIDEDSRSRWAFTSGDIEKVWDGQPGQNSPFAKHLIHFLRNNRKGKLRADELIEAVKTVVRRNTAQTPQGSPLQNVGDEGGVFVFQRKTYH